MALQAEPTSNLQKSCWQRGLMRLWIPFFLKVNSTYSADPLGNLMERVHINQRVAWRFPLLSRSSRLNRVCHFSCLSPFVWVHVMKIIAREGNWPPLRIWNEFIWWQCMKIAKYSECNPRICVLGKIFMAHKTCTIQERVAQVADSTWVRVHIEVWERFLFSRKTKRVKALQSYKWPRPDSCTVYMSECAGMFGTWSRATGLGNAVPSPNQTDTATAYNNNATCQSPCSLEEKEGTERQTRSPIYIYIYIVYIYIYGLKSKIHEKMAHWQWVHSNKLKVHVKVQFCTTWLCLRNTVCSQK